MAAELVLPVAWEMLAVRHFTCLSLSERFATNSTLKRD